MGDDIHLIKPPLDLKPRRTRLPMATLITHDRLKEIVRANEIVVGGNPDAVEGIKYDFQFGE